MVALPLAPPFLNRRRGLAPLSGPARWILEFS